MLKCPSVSKWLGQFGADERPLAALTLANLRLATNDEISHDLSEALMEKVDLVVRGKSKILIEAIVPFEDVKRYLATSQRSLRMPGNLPRMYEDYYPAEIRDTDSGSEKLLDVVIRNEYRRIKDKFAAAKQPSPIVRNKSEIDDIKGTTQDVSFILLTDQIGSGKQVIDSLERLTECCNDGPFSASAATIYILAWTATKIGLDTIADWAKNTPFQSSGSETGSKESIYDRLQIIHLNQTETFKDLSALESRDELLSLFRRYGDPKNKKSSNGLGFGQAASRTVTLGSSCPNNVPDFLYTASGNRKYQPLFPGKRVPADLNDYVASVRLNKTIESQSRHDDQELIRRNRLVVAANRARMHSDDSWGLLIQAVAGTTRDRAILASTISYYRFRRAEQRLIALGWLTSDFTPTTEGENTVRTYGRKGNHADFASAKRFMKRQVDAREITYYPQSLRGVR